MLVLGLIVAGLALAVGLLALAIARGRDRVRIEHLESELAQVQADVLRHGKALATHERVLIDKGVADREELDGEPLPEPAEGRSPGLH